MSYEFAEGYKIRDQAATHFLTFTIMSWIEFSAGNPTAMLSLIVCGFAVLIKGLKLVHLLSCPIIFIQYGQQRIIT